MKSFVNPFVDIVSNFFDSSFNSFSTSSENPRSVSGTLERQKFTEQKNFHVLIKGKTILHQNLQNHHQKKNHSDYHYYA